MDALLVTESPLVAEKLGAGMARLGLDLESVDTLGWAGCKLQLDRPRAVIVDLRWPIRQARPLATWLWLNVVRRGIPVVLTARTPLALDLQSAFLLRRAVLLRDGFGPSDVAEALETTLDSRDLAA